MIMLILVGIVLNTIGGASVVAVVPLKELSLSSGVIQTFEVLILQYGSGLGWLVKLILWFNCFWSYGAGLLMDCWTNAGAIDSC